MSKCECKDCIHYEVCDLRSTFEDLETVWCNRYKDKSLFVELPCKVGETVYCVWQYGEESVKGNPCIIEDTVEVFTFTKELNIVPSKCANLVYCGGHLLGVFLTKEEAENKLKELEAK